MREIDELYIDIPALLKKSNEPKEGFVLWLRNSTEIDKTVLEEAKKIDEILAYVKENEPEELPYWKESVVKSHALEWENRKLKEEKEKTDVAKDPQASLESFNEIAEPKVKKEKKNIQLKLDTFKGDWKKTISKAIDEHPALWFILEKYMK